MVPAMVGFLLGGACLRGIDFVLPHLHLKRSAA
jgi:zinc transporter ZupT